MEAGKGERHNSRMGQSMMSVCISYGRFLANDSKYLEEGMPYGIHIDTLWPSCSPGDSRLTTSQWSWCCMVSAREGIWYSHHDDIQEKYLTQTGGPEAFPEEESQLPKDIQD